MLVDQFCFSLDVSKLKEGSVVWQSPSNIALVKYWGKKEHQIPENTSISFTLNECKTITTLTFTKKKLTENFSFEVFLDEKPKPDFQPKISTFFKRIEAYLPFLKHYHFVIIPLHSDHQNFVQNAKYQHPLKAFLPWQNIIIFQRKT